MADIAQHDIPIANDSIKTKRKRTRRRHKKKASPGASKLRSLIKNAEKATLEAKTQPIESSSSSVPLVDSIDYVDELVVDADSDKPKANPQLNRKRSKDKKKAYLDYPNVVFVGNVPLAMDNAQLIKKMEIDPKIVKSVHFRSLPVESKFATNKRVGIIRGRLTNAKSSKNAYITLVDEKHVDEVLQKNTKEVDGHYLFVNKASPSSFSVRKIPPYAINMQKFNRKKTVFVGRLPPSTTENELFDVFSNVGLVKDVRIIRDPRTFESKGFGFVAFDTRAAVPEAIETFNNKEFKVCVVRFGDNCLQGYTLHVTKALDHEAAMQQKVKRSKNVKYAQKKTSKPTFKSKSSRKK
ncbi:RNA recognition motif domain containing protein [Babesia divergens]|uniref:RNA recognition motif domain containing protein n=1 Tax=Babesia divergens TaxID=32595 RepID=A0AAD9LDQ5_BABDI|nr:RNA recognition motif domain containing protein [Babesia divergens]